MSAAQSEEITAKSALVRNYGKIVLTLENCLLPVGKLEVTPSRLDGLDHDTETDLRILGCELIQTSGILLKLPQVRFESPQQRVIYKSDIIRFDHRRHICLFIIVWPHILSRMIIKYNNIL